METEPPTPDVPEVVVEVAAKARYEVLLDRQPDRGLPAWEDLAPPSKHGYLDDARINLEAAFQFLLRDEK